jgi:predicted transcriptional regulator
MTTNNTRAKHAQAALRAYVKAKKGKFENSTDEITDLVKDLLHLIVRDHGLEEVERILRHAQRDFDYEQNNVEDEDAE